jgi:5-methylcytosine-specific restriction protein A
MPGLKVCQVPGCPTLTRGPYCATHGPTPYPSGSAASRGYDAFWRRQRLALLRAEPFCRRCRLRDGRSLQLAQEVDHIIPILEGGDRLDPANLQPLCTKCHREKSLEDRFRRGETCTRP